MVKVMEFLKVMFICVFMLFMSRSTLGQNFDSIEAAHRSIKDEEKHMQKRDHQGLIPHMFKLGQTLTTPKQTKQARPQPFQEIRTQTLQPRQTQHGIPQALQQRSQAIQQRPINLRLNTATNPPRRLANLTKYTDQNNNTSAPSTEPIPHHELPNNDDVKATPLKEDAVSTIVPNNSVLHILIPKETSNSDKIHKAAEFFEDEDDGKDNTPIYNPEYLHKMDVNNKRLGTNKLEPQDISDHNFKKMVADKKPNKIQPITEITDHDDTNFDDRKLTNIIREQKKAKPNVMDEEIRTSQNTAKLTQEKKKSDHNTEKKAASERPELKTTKRNEHNKLLQSIRTSPNNYNCTDDNFISIKARKSENQIKNLKKEIKNIPTSTQPTKNDKVDNIVIQNRTYEEIYERSINSNPSVLNNKRSCNIHTPEYSTYLDKYQDNSENKSPVYLYSEDYINQILSTNNIKCNYNQYTNSYENDPNIFLDRNKPTIEYIHEDRRINNGAYDEQTNIEIADYNPIRPNNYIDRIWRTWRNSEVRINNNINKQSNEDMDCKQEEPNKETGYNIQEPENTVIPITNRNLIGVNGCFKNQNIPVKCRYCPSYQCYY